MNDLKGLPGIDYSLYLKLREEKRMRSLGMPGGVGEKKVTLDVAWRHLRENGIVVDPRPFVGATVTLIRREGGVKLKISFNEVIITYTFRYEGLPSYEVQAKRGFESAAKTLMIHFPAPRSNWKMPT